MQTLPNLPRILPAASQPITPASFTPVSEVTEDSGDSASSNGDDDDSDSSSSGSDNDNNDDNGDGNGDDNGDDNGDGDSDDGDGGGRARLLGVEERSHLPVS